MTNVYSKKFTIQTADSHHKKLYKQEFKSNLSQICEPKISDFPGDASDYTEVVFEPDLKRFHMSKLDDDIVSLFKKRVYDLAGCTPPTVNIYLDGKKIDNVKNFQQYVDMYLKDKS